MTAPDGIKWKMGIPELIIIISLIIALTTTLNTKAPSKDLARVEGRVSTLEMQFITIVANQTRLELLLKEIDAAQRETNDRLSRIEQAHGIESRRGK